MITLLRGLGTLVAGTAWVGRCLADELYRLLERANETTLMALLFAALFVAGLGLVLLIQIVGR